MAALTIDQREAGKKPATKAARERRTNAVLTSFDDAR
jgi:hypothetical protein